MKGVGRRLEDDASAAQLVELREPAGRMEDMLPQYGRRVLPVAATLAAARRADALAEGKPCDPA